MMVRFLFRRLLLIPLALVLVNFLGFAFAHITFQFQQSQSVYGSGQEGITPVWPEYLSYAQNAARGDFGKMPIGINEPISASLWRASLASLGLVTIAFILSVFLGLALGLASVQVDPPQTGSWLTVLSTTGLAMPSFYLGTLLVSGLLFFAIRMNADPLIPVAGFGWDIHLLLPVLALVVRPTMQLAQVSASLLSSELGKRYVMAARSFGHTWQAIRWDKALRNVMAPIFLTMAGSFRLLMAELVLVEWLFNWPGLGRLLVQSLVPPSLSAPSGLLDTSAFFLDPPLVAGLLVVFALLFLLADLLASVMAKIIDPRLRAVEEGAAHD
jgi:peptide/nickel transport system permease protein